MVNFLTKAYELVFGSWLYSKAMDYYLIGLDLKKNEFVYSNKYPLLWFIAIATGGIVLPAVYYKLIDRDSWATTRIWAFFGLAGSLLVFLATVAVLWDQANHIGSPLNEYTAGENGVDMFDILGVGFAQFLITFVFYFATSFLWKRWSYNCRYIPR